MIRDLTISNLGVIEHTRLDFHPGLTVLTGETGAGKTLITTALSLLLGGKTEASLVRHGTAEAVIDCTISNVDDALLHECESIGALLDDRELIVSRNLGARSRAFVGSRPVAAAVLQNLLGERITVHGQHGQVRLTRMGDQRNLLDEADREIGELLPLVRQAWVNLRDANAVLASRIAAVDQDQQTNNAHLLLVQDVSSVAPERGEDVALDARIATLASLDAIQRATRTAAAILVDGESLDLTDGTSLLARARHVLEPHSDLPEVAEWLMRLAEAQEAVSEVAHDILGFVDDLESDESRLDALLARRAQIGSLLRRWNCDLGTLLERFDDASRALALAADPEGALAEIQVLVEHCSAELDGLCARLHSARKSAAQTLSKQVEDELRALDLAHAQFEIEVLRQHSPTAHGDDLVEFRFSANPGQPLQPLAVVGSGGELSRVMLALETVAGDATDRTFVFDEVDAGVGGKAALEIGRRLSVLASQRQVIVVTHLAQVAAFADRHIVVEKIVESGTTSTTARTLREDERPREMTRLLSGLEASDVAIAHAAELLQVGRAVRGDAT